MPIRQKWETPVCSNKARRKMLASRSRWNAWQMRPETTTAGVKGKAGFTISLPNGLSRRDENQRNCFEFRAKV
jgi:hypothetical protein